MKHCLMHAGPLLVTEWGTIVSGGDRFCEYFERFLFLVKIIPEFLFAFLSSDGSYQTG